MVTEENSKLSDEMFHVQLQSKAVSSESESDINNPTSATSLRNSRAN